MSLLSRFGRTFHNRSVISRRRNRIHSPAAAEALEDRIVLSVNVLYEHPNTTFDENLFAANIEAALNGNVVGYGYSISVDGAQGPAGGGGIGGTDGGVAVSSADLSVLLGIPVGFTIEFDEDTEIEVASVSKLISSIAVNLAIQNHAFADLDHPMAAYLPTSWTLGNNIAGISIRDLLGHLSGFGEDYTSATEVGNAAAAAVNVDFNSFANNNDANLQTMVAYGVNNPGDVQQTGNYFYSNVNYSLMRYIIPILSGDVAADETDPQAYADAFRDYVQDNIFQPAGVTAQLFDNSPLQARRYRPVTADPGLNSPGATTGTDRTLVSGAIGWKMSANDLSRVLRYVFHDDTSPLNSATLQEMQDDLLGFRPAESQPNGNYGAYYGHDGLQTDTGLGSTAGTRRRMRSSVTVFPNDVQASLIVNSDTTAGLNAFAVVQNAYDNSWPEVAIGGTPLADEFQVDVVGSNVRVTVVMGTTGLTETFTAPISVLERLTLVGLSGGDSFLINALPGSVDLEIAAGLGSDFVHIAPLGNLDVINGNVSVDGGLLGDTLVIDDSLHVGLETYTINSGIITRTGLPLFAFSHSGIETLQLEGGTSSNTYEINGTADGVDVTVTGGSLNDTFRVGNGDIDTNLGDGLLHIVGGANGDAGDHLILEDTDDTAHDDYTFDDDEFSKSSYGGMTYEAVERVSLDANHFDNDIHVLRTPVGTALAISVGSGTNTVFAGNGDFDTNIRGDLTVIGGFGFDRFVILDDLDNVGNDTYVFNGPAGSSPATFDKTDYNWTTSYSSFVNSVELEGSDFSNTVFLNGVGVGAAVTLDMNAGNDQVHIGSGVLEDFAEMITIDGGGDTDDITLHDESDTGDDTYWVGNNFAIKSAFSLSYSNAESLTLNANPDQNTINVESVLATTPMFINAGDASDTIHVAPTAQQLSLIQAALSVNGEGGADSIFLHDELSNPLDPLPFAVTTDQVTRPLPPIIIPRFELSYEQAELLQLQLGAAGDLVSILSTAPGMHVVVEAGFGDDTVLADVPTSAQLTLDGGNGTDTLELLGTAAADVVSISAGTGADVGLISFENASIDMAGGDDVLVLEGLEGANEQMEVQATTTANAGTLSVAGALDLNFTNTENLDLLANAGDADTASFLGTALDDQFEINLGADGTMADPVLQLFQPGGVTPLLTLLDYRNFGLLNVLGDDGADLFNVFAVPTGPEAGRNLNIDGGSPSGNGNPKDRLNVYREFEPPGPGGGGPGGPGGGPGGPSDSGTFLVNYDDFSFKIAYSDIEVAKLLPTSAAN